MIKNAVPVCVLGFTLILGSNAASASVLLKGIACTDSEEWSITSAAIAQNSELKDTLTSVPSSESSAISKWKLLQKFTKQLNANQQLQGSWGYWYYRAALAANLPVYAEAGFLELQKTLKPGSPYLVATQACLQVLKFKFRGVEGRSTYVTQEKQDQEFFKSLSAHDLKKVYSQFKPLYEKAKSDKNDQKANALLAMYAEELYTQGKFKEADAAAKKVDKKSERYPQALLVMAWSAFREKNYAQAVGHSFSLMKSYPQTFEALEAVWMASAAFLESCLNQEAMKTLEFFKSQVLTLEEWIKKNQPAMMKEPYEFYKKKIQDPEVPFLLKREWLKSGRIAILQNHLNSLVDEKTKVDQWKQEPGFYRIDQIDRQVIALKSYYQKELGKEFIKSTALANQEIEAHIEKGQLLETDILGALGQGEVLQPTAKSVTTAKQKISLRKKVIWARAGFQKGIGERKSEVWLDDIGNFVGDFKNACKP